MKILLSTAIVFFTMISTGSTLLCYVCGQNPDCSTVRDCPLPTPNYLEETRARYFPDSKVDYSKVQNLPKPVCYTSVISEGGTQTSRRACSALGSELTCDVLRNAAKSKNQTVDSCVTCAGDFCNSDQPSVSSQTGVTVETLQWRPVTNAPIPVTKKPSAETRVEVVSTTALPLVHNPVNIKNAAVKYGYVKFTLIVSVVLTVFVSAVIR